MFALKHVIPGVEGGSPHTELEHIFNQNAIISENGPSHTTRIVTLIFDEFDENLSKAKLIDLERSKDYKGLTTNAVFLF